MRSALAPLLPLLPLFAALSVDELVLSGRCDFREISRPGPFVHEPAIVRADNETACRRAPPTVVVRRGARRFGNLDGLGARAAPLWRPRWARQRSTVGKLLSEAAGCELDQVAHLEPSAHLADPAAVPARAAAQGSVHTFDSNLPSPSQAWRELARATHSLPDFDNVWHSAGALPLSVSLARDGTGFAPHASGPSYLRLAFGARLWAVWPPTATPWAPTADRYKALLERVHLDPNVSLCVQRAGEAVVVPTLWGSATVSVGDSLGFGGTRALETSDVLDHRESILAPPDGAAANVHLQLARAAVVAARAGATSARGIAGAQEVAQALAAPTPTTWSRSSRSPSTRTVSTTRVASIRRDHDACRRRAASC